VTKNDTLDELYEKFNGKYSKQLIKYVVYHIEQSTAHYIRNPSIGIGTVRFTKNILIKASARKMRDYIKGDYPLNKKEELRKYLDINGEEE